MKNKIISVIMAVVFMLSLVSCAQEAPTSLTSVNLKIVAAEELGPMMPKIIYAEDGKIAFWGVFGLYIVNGEDGSIYRSVNLENIGFNHINAELTTRFLVSSNYKRIYFYNEGPDGENIEDFYYFYDIEEDTVRQLPVGTGVEVAGAYPVFSLYDAGGYPEKGYCTEALFYDQDMLVYLYAEQWTVNSLELVFYNTETTETNHVKIFTKENIKKSKEL